MRAAVDGNMRATTALLSLFARDPLDADQTDEITPEERAVLDEYLDREVRRRAAAIQQTIPTTQNRRLDTMKRELTRVAQRDFLAFAKMVLRELDGTVIDNDPYIELLATDLMDFADGSTKRLLINMPAAPWENQLGLHLQRSLDSWRMSQVRRSWSSPIPKTLSESIARSIRNILQSDVFKKIFRYPH